MENNSSTVTQEPEGMVDQASQAVSDSGKRFAKSFSESRRDVHSTIKKSNLGQHTVPDAFRATPKFISPTVHAWLDAAVTTYFLGLGIWYAVRRKRRPATAAFVNAGMVAGVSMLTDYRGTGKKPISFKLHGTLDAVQAATAGLGPLLHGFTDKPASAFFYAQAFNELAVVACTDWDAGTPNSTP